MTKTSPRPILLICCSIFFMFGLFNGGLGPVLSELAVQTGSTLAAIGSLFTFMFLGALIAMIIAGPLTDRFGQRLVLIISLFLLGGGLLGVLNSKTLPVMLVLVVITGFGGGGVQLGTNLVVAEAFPTNSTSVLNLLHFFSGFGAFVGPALIGLAIAKVGSGLIIQWIAAFVFFILAIGVIILLKNKSNKITKFDQSQLINHNNNKIYMSPLLWFIGISILFYVGIEYGLGSWVSSYMNTSTQMALQIGAFVTSAYWGAIMLGRLVGAALSKKMTKIQLLKIALFGSVIGSVGLVLSHGFVTPTIVSLVVISFFIGPVYPTTIALTASTFSTQQGKAVGALAAMGCIGGLSIPWIAGFLLEKTSSLIYVLFITFCITFLLCMVLVINRTFAQKQPTI